MALLKDVNVKCKNGVNKGEYIVRVYVKTSSMLVHEVNHVTVKSLTTTTSTGKMSPPSPSISTLVIHLMKVKVSML